MPQLRLNLVVEVPNPLITKGLVTALGVILFGKDHATIGEAYERCRVFHKPFAHYDLT